MSSSSSSIKVKLTLNIDKVTDQQKKRKLTKVKALR